jgi:ferredoxin
VTAVQVEVDRSRCMGTGACVYTAPDVFGLDHEGLVTVVGEVRPGDDLVADAVAECPMAALRLVDA